MNRLFTLAAGLALLCTLTAGAPVAGRSYTGQLYDRESGSLDLTLYRGTTYYYSGTCDLYCGDLDFALYEWVPPYSGRRGYWRFVVSDRASDDTPGFSVSPGYDTTFRLSIIMSRCMDEPCRYDVNVAW